VVDIPTTNQAVEMCYYCSTAAVDAVDAGEEKNHKTGMRKGGRPPGPTRYHDRHVHGSSPSGEGGYGRACVWWRNLLDLRLSSTQWHPKFPGPDRGMSGAERKNTSRGENWRMKGREKETKTQPPGLGLEYGGGRLPDSNYRVRSIGDRRLPY
jgi:hypothetical protein